jgi:hypothetical protein
MRDGGVFPEGIKVPPSQFTVECKLLVTLRNFRSAVMEMLDIAKGKLSAGIDTLPVGGLATTPSIQPFNRLLRIGRVLSSQIH